MYECQRKQLVSATRETPIKKLEIHWIIEDNWFFEKRNWEFEIKTIEDRGRERPEKKIERIVSGEIEGRIGSIWNFDDFKRKWKERFDIWVGEQLHFPQRRTINAESQLQ